mmetsp:Transcript_18251/g.59939  ORF Transcript_18251/g.59939 Transcript_18251/m.59939 type:complete len:226 (+) Transcript_18251:2496-3173(+)
MCQDVSDGSTLQVVGGASAREVGVELLVREVGAGGAEAHLDHPQTVEGGQDEDGFRAEAWANNRRHPLGVKILGDGSESLLLHNVELSRRQETVLRDRANSRSVADDHADGDPWQQSRILIDHHGRYPCCRCGVLVLVPGVPVLHEHPSQDDPLADPQSTISCKIQVLQRAESSCAAPFPNDGEVSGNRLIDHVIPAHFGPQVGGEGDVTRSAFELDVKQGVLQS